MRTSQWDAENRGASEIERHSLTPRLTPSRIAVRRGCAKPPPVSQLVCTIHVWPPQLERNIVSATTTVLVNGPTRVTKRNSRPTHDQSKEDRDASHKGCAVHILPITFTGTIHRLCYNRFASAHSQIVPLLGSVFIRRLPRGVCEFFLGVFSQFSATVVESGVAHRTDTAPLPLRYMLAFETSNN
ncbi:hypothetical protein VFPPC_18107 [Pochonia chlamydosporia 170]|uniref:Uncharacterized protein n=1 Tax=Pochonia chlamydosporia 170 TaxID=1380566 RepID=A0A219AQW1_METCM|nr:hypothetical protein VFPPC_18107 [Pochonia chlamydosporia 170]OWT42694.1 hypothetical protein VFPPC_18107 [Pochonia chlamydosporia 170]